MSSQGAPKRRGGRRSRCRRRARPALIFPAARTRIDPPPAVGRAPSFAYRQLMGQSNRAERRLRLKKANSAEFSVDAPPLVQLIYNKTLDVGEMAVNKGRHFRRAGRN